MSSYAEILSSPAAKPSRREQILRLAMELLTLASIDEENEFGFAEKDGTGPEVYVAPRYSPAP